ncbi:MAG: hypothetical protein WC358_09645 [Ignavibacteria bacterium]|jgi:hypothetical protein
MDEVNNSENLFDDFAQNITFTPEFWEQINESIRKENQEYEKLCRSLKIDPVSGKSTMSWEERNRPFNC